MGNGQVAGEAQSNGGFGRSRRRLGVCKGDAYELMVEEILKGANVVISGDSGKMPRVGWSVTNAPQRTHGKDLYSPRRRFSSHGHP